METKYDRFYINENMSVYDAAKVIDGNTKKTAFLVRDGILLGAISDGDLRRFLLNKGDVNISVKEIVNYNPVFLYEDSVISNYSKFMIEHAITALPIVDEQKKIIKIEFLNNSDIVVEKIKERIPVVVMAGGKGTRLKPYTDIIPKPLIPVGEQTITEHILNRYMRHGCKNFYLILNYKKNLIKAYFRETPVSANISFVEEELFLGTAGGLKLLPKEIGDVFFVTNCDILVDADYKKIYDMHILSNNIITMVIAKKKLTIPYGTIQTDDNGQIKELVEKPTFEYNINTGMYVCSKKIFEYIMDNEVLDMPILISRCMDLGERVGTYQIETDEWMDMGQFDELENMKSKI